MGVVTDRAFRKALGAKLRQKRTARGLTLAKAAKGTGLTDSAISRYELGDTPVPPERLARLAKCYRCRTVDFFEGLPA